MFREQRGIAAAKNDHDREHSLSQLTGSTSSHKFFASSSRHGAPQFGISIGYAINLSVSFRYVNYKIKYRSQGRNNEEYSSRLTNVILKGGCTWKVIYIPLFQRVCYP